MDPSPTFRTLLVAMTITVCGAVFAIDPPIPSGPCSPLISQDPILSIQLVWQPSVGATDYQVQVSFLDPNFNSIVIDMNTSGITFAEVGYGMLYYDAYYYWRVRATDGATWSTWSTVCDFPTIPIPIPPAPILVAPSNGATNIQPNSVGLQWNIVFGIDVEIQVATNPSFTSPMIINTSGWQHTVTGLLYAQTYYWRVRESVVSGTSPWSSAWSFTSQSVPTSVNLRMNLQGPWNTTTQLMDDDLRIAGLLPSNQPYSALGFTDIVNAGATIGPTVLSTNGGNAIVDWVLLEFRGATSPVVLTRFALLLQRDGDVMMPNGNALSLTLPAGQVKIAIRHRNHLGCMASQVINNNGSSISVDMTSPSTSMYGTDATLIDAGKRFLWSGDVNNDGTIAYTGVGNDRDPILVTIGGSIPTATATGYLQEDVDLNGAAKYTGAKNDRDPILVNVGGSVPTATRMAQLP